MNAPSIPSAERSRVSTGLDPFVHAQGPNSYFETPAIRQRIDLVRHLVEFGRQIIVISGPPGAGKSAMLTRVCDNADVSWRLLQFIGGPALNQSTLFTKIGDELEIPKPVDKSGLLESIRRAIKAANARGETIILTVDDAHKLPSDTPSGLAELAHCVDESAELKIIVAADPSQTPLVEHLQHGTSGQTLVHVVEVPRFNSEQTLELLKHRWNVAYATDEIPLSDAEIAQIYQQSNGVPGKAIVLARQVQILSDQPGRSGSDPARRYVLIGAALIGLFLIFAFFNAEKSSHEQGTEVPLELPTMAAKPDPVEKLPRGAARKIAPKPTPSTPTVTENRPQGTLQGTGLADRPVPEPEVLSPNPNVIPNETSKSAIEEVDESNAASSLRDGDKSNDESTEKTPSKVRVTIRAPKNVAEIAKPTAALDQASKKTEAIQALQPTELAKAEPPVETSRYSIKWLLQQPNTGYVLQLFGGRNRSAAEKFIREKKISADSDLLATEHAGGPWYVVVYKYYPDRIGAQRAIRELPANLASTKPWSRPISSLK